MFAAEVNPDTCKKLRNAKELKRTVRKKPQDIRILCVAESHKQSMKHYCLLATVDHHDFLSNSSTIERLIGIKCIDPIYPPNEFSSR